ncbi:MAG TPA: hypothetical protein VF409_09535 [Sphingomonas sp.]
MKRIVILGLVLTLAACGAARDLKPAPGKALPVAPYGATAAPNAKQLLAASSQARPGRSDELLTNSEERQGNEFDLPPAN